MKYAVALKVVGHRAEEERAAAVVGGPALPREVGGSAGRSGNGAASAKDEGEKGVKDLSALQTTTMTE